MRTTAARGTPAQSRSCEEASTPSTVRIFATWDALRAVTSRCAGGRTGEHSRAMTSASAVSGELRQVTVVFSDLSGFTAMSERLDPEDVQDVTEQVFGAARGIIESYGGRVDKLLGDAVMAVFGDPVAHEDDAERAVRAALGVHRAVAELSPSVEARTG